jgi:hypothetical protein
MMNFVEMFLIGNPFKQIFVPVGLFLIFCFHGKYSAKTRTHLTTIFAILMGLTIGLKLSSLNEGYFLIVYGFTTIYAASIFVGVGSQEKTDIGKPVRFCCPYCNTDLEFDFFDKGLSKNCLHCNEIVTVTDDAEVHLANKESRDAILEAMNDEELQVDPKSLTESSIATSMFGAQFDLKIRETSDESKIRKPE